MLIKKADQPPEFEQSVLEWSGRQEDLGAPLDRNLYSGGDPVGRLVDVSEAMSLVHDHEIPVDGSDRLLPGSSEVVRADDDPRSVGERICRTAFQAGGIGTRVEDL